MTGNASTARSLEPAGGVTTILLVEDQPDAQQMLESIVQQVYPGAVTTACATVAHALMQVGRPWSLALIDLRLLDGSGVDVLRAFKARHAEVPAVVTTMYSDDASVFGALQAGADGYLLKSEPPQMLADSGSGQLSAPSGDEGEAMDGHPLKQRVRAYERRLIDEAVSAAPSKRQAARALGIDIASLLRKLQE